MKMTYKTMQFLSLFILISSFSCKKSNQVEKIPYVPVSTTIYLNLPSNVALNSIGNYVKISGGYKGIIVYRRSQTEFAAFDLACPYDPTTSGAILEIDTSGVTAYDKHCGSKFNLAYGSIVSGPATMSMKTYNADYDGSNTVYIYN